MSADDIRWSVVGRSPYGVDIVDLDGDGIEKARRTADETDLASVIAATEPGRRWVWPDTARWYPPVLSRGMRVARSYDLRLAHAILADSAWVEGAEELRADGRWRAAPAEDEDVPALFRMEQGPQIPTDITDALTEFARQRAAVASAKNPERLRLLIAAESAGALIAAEMTDAGLPWDADIHNDILTEVLGPRPRSGELPARVQAAADAVRAALDDPRASLDSPPKLLRALHRVGVDARSTNRWELAEFDHPAITPLLAYKKLTRLLSANGWAWQEEWAREGRFRPVYIPGGVVTGRWASSGGGALQLPRNLRPAVHADPGWTLVIADVAQLEPRVLAAMSRDTAMAAAARGTDLYEGIVASGVVASRQDAKIAVLGAMYGATTGDSGRLVPALRRAYPRAMHLVDDAAARGEEGDVVTTWLGRSSPPPSADWREIQARASDEDAVAAATESARRSARDRGRFTRNFVVQGSAAEWALVWLADLRARLADLPQVATDRGAPRSRAVFSRRAHLAFFLHDEIIVHAPAEHADAVAAAVQASADAATASLFGGFPLDFRLDLRIRADAAKD